MALKARVVNGVVVSQYENSREVLTRRAPYFCVEVKSDKGEKKNVKFDSRESKRND